MGKRSAWHLNRVKRIGSHNLSWSIRKGPTYRGCFPKLKLIDYWYLSERQMLGRRARLLRRARGASPTLAIVETRNPQNLLQTSFCSHNITKLQRLRSDLCRLKKIGGGPQYSICFRFKCPNKFDDCRVDFLSFALCI